MAGTDLKNLMVWETTGVGKPVCVADRNDGGYSITLYLDEYGAIKGVMVYDESTLVSATGTIPAEVLMEELKYA